MSGMPDELEFWLDDKPILFMQSSHSPLVGDLVSIRKKTYEVTSRNFAVDHSDFPSEKRVRLICNIEVIE